MQTFLCVIGLASICFSCGSEREPSKTKKKVEVETIAALGALPKYVTDPPENKSTPEKIRLGKLLFFAGCP